MQLNAQLCDWLQSLTTTLRAELAVVSWQSHCVLLVEAFGYNQRLQSVKGFK